MRQQTSRIKEAVKAKVDFLDAGQLVRCHIRVLVAGASHLSRAGDARILRLRAYLPPATGFTRPMPAPPTHLAVTGFNVEHRLVKICWQ